MSTLLHVVFRVTGSDAAAMLASFNLVWLSWAGYPIRIILDRDPKFLGIFRRKLKQQGIDLVYVPSGAHWQMGRIENYDDPWWMRPLM